MAWLFMASAAEKAVIVADLSQFKRAGSIALGSIPTRNPSLRRSPVLYGEDDVA